MAESAKKVFVCGAGHQGMSMAAHLALSGLEVNLWNRTKANIQEIIDTGIIHCSGIVSGDAKITKVSDEFSELVADFIMVAAPSGAHRDIAKRLAPFVTPDMVVILNPGRTFGAVEFAEELKRNGITELPQIAETQTIVYTCRRSDNNSATIFALKNDVKIAAIKGSDINYILDRMPDCLKPYFNPVDSVALTSFDNIGMVLHCAPVFMNIGWIESDKADFKYYYDGISPSVAHFIEKVDEERRLVANAAGYEIESVQHWLERTYPVTGNNLFECLQNNEAYHEIDAPQTIHTRYVFEDIPNGLVPIETVGKELGVYTPCITAIINLAQEVTDVDYREVGRRFTMEQLRKYF